MPCLTLLQRTKPKGRHAVYYPRDLYHLGVVAAVACEGGPGAFLVAVVVAVIGVVVVVIAAACWAYIDIQTYIRVAVERGTHSSLWTQWSYPGGGRFGDGCS